jgi:hypothetical protein
VKPERSQRRPRSRREDGCAGAVSEQPRGAAVVVVDQPADDVGADHQRHARAAGLDRAGGQLQARDEAGAGGTEVDRSRRLGSDPRGDKRCGVGQHPVIREGGDEHQVNVGRGDAGALEGDGTRIGGKLDQRQVGRGHTPLVDAGARGDPGRVEAESLGDRLVCDGALWQRRADGRDAGRHARGLDRLRRARRAGEQRVTHGRPRGRRD